MSMPGIEDAVKKLQAAAALAAGQGPASGQEVPPVDFSVVMKSVIEQVNSEQQASREMQKQYELGNTDNLVDVMVSWQQADISFKAMKQVRDKLVAAYQEVMNINV